MRPFLLILSAPSGGGKTTVAKALLAARDDLTYSVSATTRAARDGERDGVDYHFLTEAEFKRKRDAGEFLEWAEYGGALYGTLSDDVRRSLDSGKHVVLDIDVQGARQVRKVRHGDCQVVSIFILPPSAQVLVERLRDRGGVETDKLSGRLRAAQGELEEASQYDYVVVNEDRTQVVSEVAAIVDSESRRTCRISSLEENLVELREGLSEVLSKMGQHS